MKDPTTIHKLAQMKAKSGKIVFIHKDGSTRSFSSVVNRLTGSRLSYFDSSSPSIDDDLSWVKSVFRDIKAKCKVIECIGDF